MMCNTEQSGFTDTITTTNNDAGIDKHPSTTDTGNTKYSMKIPYLYMISITRRTIIRFKRMYILLLNYEYRPIIISNTSNLYFQLS